MVYEVVPDGPIRLHVITLSLAVSRAEVPLVDPASGSQGSKKWEENHLGTVVLVIKLAFWAPVCHNV